MKSSHHGVTEVTEKEEFLFVPRRPGQIKKLPDSAEIRFGQQPDGFIENRTLPILDKNGTLCVLGASNES